MSVARFCFLLARFSMKVSHPVLNVCCMVPLKVFDWTGSENKLRRQFLAMVVGLAVWTMPRIWNALVPSSAEVNSLAGIRSIRAGILASRLASGGFLHLGWRRSSHLLYFLLPWFSCHLSVMLERQSRILVVRLCQFLGWPSYGFRTRDSEPPVWFLRPLLSTICTLNHFSTVLSHVLKTQTVQKSLSLLLPEKQSVIFVGFRV